MIPVVNFVHVGGLKQNIETDTLAEKLAIVSVTSKINSDTEVISIFPPLPPSIVTDDLVSGKQDQHNNFISCLLTIYPCFLYIGFKSAK